MRLIDKPYFSVSGKDELHAELCVNTFWQVCAMLTAHSSAYSTLALSFINQCLLGIVRRVNCRETASWKSSCGTAPCSVSKTPRK